MLKGKKNRILIFFLIAFVLFAMDGILKYWVFHSLSSMQYVSPFYPFGGIGVFYDFLGIDFCITKVVNRGGAWGMLSSHPQFLLTLRIAIIFSVFIYALFFNKERKRDLPLMLVLTGASANIFDGFIYGAVVDMFYFILWGYSFPVFNIADTLIVFGIIIMAWQMTRVKLKKKPNPHFSQT